MTRDEVVAFISRLSFGGGFSDWGLKLEADFFIADSVYLLR